MPPYIRLWESNKQILGLTRRSCQLKPNAESEVMFTLRLKGKVHDIWFIIELTFKDPS